MDVEHSVTETSVRFSNFVTCVPDNLCSTFGPVFRFTYTVLIPVSIYTTDLLCLIDIGLRFAIFQYPQNPLATPNYHVSSLRTVNLLHTDKNDSL